MSELKCTEELIERVSTAVREHFKTRFGEFDEETPLRHAFNTVIDWLEDD